MANMPILQLVKAKRAQFLADAGAVVIAVLGLAGVRKYRHAK